MLYIVCKFIVMKTIENKIKQFEISSSISLKVLNPVMQKNYQAIIRMLIEKETMPEETLVQLARRIKPLMLPKYAGNLRYQPYWTKPVPLTQSFYFNFDEDSVLRNAEGKIIEVSGLEKVCEFTCYHRYGGYYGILRPGMDEVIQQFPTYLLEDEKAEYAILLKFSSSGLEDVYDRVLNRHVSTVDVYRLQNGLPQELRDQEVIYR